MASNRRSSTVSPATITDALAADDVSADDVFDCLADSRRRYLLEYLQERGSDVDRGDVAEAMASRELGADDAPIGESDRERAEVRLHHVDLPKLAGTGLVEYDPESETVALSPDAETILEEL